MHRLATMVLGLAALLIAAAVSHTAQAGEYYDGGYVYRGDASYASNCCYRKVVRYVRKVSYVRVHEAPRYRSSYYDSGPYRPVVYRTYSDPYRYDGGAYYRGYAPERISYADPCTTRRVRVADGYGGWVWATTRVCY